MGREGNALDVMLAIIWVMLLEYSERGDDRGSAFGICELDHDVS